MIYLSFSYSVPAILEGVPSMAAGSAGPSPGLDISLFSFSFPGSHLTEVFAPDPVFASVSGPLPFSGALLFDVSVEVSAPVPVFLAVGASLPEFSIVFEASVLYSPPVPIPALVSSALPAFSMGLEFSFSYEPPPADYFIETGVSLALLDNFSAPGVSVLIEAPSFLDFSAAFPVDCGSDFLSSEFSLEFTALFPWLPDSLPDGFFDMAPGLSVSVEAPSTPFSGSASLPDDFLSGLASLVVIPPALPSYALGLPGFPSAPPVVSVYVYDSSYLSLPVSLPPFPLAASVAVAVSPDLVSISISARVIDFSLFSGSPGAVQVPPCFLSVSGFLPDFSFQFLMDESFGPAGSSVYFPGNFFYAPVFSGLIVPSPLDPILVSFPLPVPAGFFVSPAAYDSAVWKVGIESFIFLVSGKKY